MLSEEYLAEVTARCEAATPGPWRIAKSGESVWPMPENGDYKICCETEIEDAEFIANVRTDIPVLLAEIDRLKAELENLNEVYKNRIELHHAAMDESTRNKRLLEEMTTERDQWKSRVQELGKDYNYAYQGLTNCDRLYKALEREIMSYVEGTKDALCGICEQFGCAVCDNKHLFQIDHTKIIGGVTND